jgi:hypothetical protein
VHQNFLGVSNLWQRAAAAPPDPPDDYAPDMPEREILRRLLAVTLASSDFQAPFVLRVGEKKRLFVSFMSGSNECFRQLLSSEGRAG